MAYMEGYWTPIVTFPQLESILASSFAFLIKLTIHNSACSLSWNDNFSANSLLFGKKVKSKKS